MRSARLRKRLSINELARRVGCPQPYLSMLEHGHRSVAKVSYRRAVRIARALDVDPEAIFGEEADARRTAR